MTAAAQLVDELVRKLKGGTSQSPFMQAWRDTKKARLDLKECVAALQGDPERILRELVERGEFEPERLRATLASSGSEAAAAGKQLAALLARSREERRDFGVDSLRVGFPLLRLYEANGRELLCPLLLWKVRLELDNGRYVLSRDSEDIVELNDPLCSYLLAEHELDLREVDKRASGAHGLRNYNDVLIERLVAAAVAGSTQGSAFKEAQAEAMRKLARALRSPRDAAGEGSKAKAEAAVLPRPASLFGKVANAFSSSFSLRAAADAEAAEAAAAAAEEGAPAAHAEAPQGLEPVPEPGSGTTVDGRDGIECVYAAVLGLFKTSSATILNDLEGYRARGEVALGARNVLGPKDLVYSGLPLDPSQLDALRQLAEHKNLVINGPPGTGKSQTIAALVACAVANDKKVLVVCEKTTPLAILQRALEQVRWAPPGSKLGAAVWSGDRCTALITDTHESREEVVSKALRNRAALEQAGLTCETLHEEERKHLGTIERLRGEISAEEAKFERHATANAQRVSFGLTLREAVAFVVASKLASRILLKLPSFEPGSASADLQELCFADDHLMRIDRCEENIPPDVVEVLGKIRLAALRPAKQGSVGGGDKGDSGDKRRESGGAAGAGAIDPEEVVRAAESLRDKVDKATEARAEVIREAHKVEVAACDAAATRWKGHLDDLEALGKQLESVPRDQLLAHDAPSWLDRALDLLGGRASLRYLGSTLRKVEAKVDTEDEVLSGNVVKPASFTLSNIERLITWCRGVYKRAATKADAAAQEPPLAHWQRRHAQLEKEQPWATRMSEANERIKDLLKGTAFDTAAMREAFSEVIKAESMAGPPKAAQHKAGLEAKGLKLGLDKLLVPFLRPALGSWRVAAESLGCLLELGVAQDERFFADFLAATARSSKDSASWGQRIKLACLAHTVSSACQGLITSDFILDKLADSQAQIAREMNALFHVRSAKSFMTAVERFENPPDAAAGASRGRFEQLFNRASRGIRTNALREIVRDRELFCNVFPCVFTTPEVASALFRGRGKDKDCLFDLCVVDEASQSLLHDAYAAMLKARKVVVAGDKNQMPPSNLFAAGGGGGGGGEGCELDDDLGGSDSENESPAPPASRAAAGAASSRSHGKGRAKGKAGANVRLSRNAANAESLLDWASEHSLDFRSVDLSFHYRSLRPELMRFHCAAVYPSLSLCPEKQGSVAASLGSSAGPAIQVTLVRDAVYRDQSNRREALKVIEVLRDVVLAGTGSSIAVATFNEVQKKLILALIKASTDARFMGRLRELQSRGRFFVKNLENLQGDEVDELLVSTTFGPNASGGFERRFGRILHAGVGYRYLNVLFSRAKRRVHVITSIPESEFQAPTRELDDLGCLSGASFLNGYLSYAQAVAARDDARVASVLREYSVVPSAEIAAPSRVGVGAASASASASAAAPSSSSSSSSSSSGPAVAQAKGAVTQQIGAMMSLEDVLYDKLTQRAAAPGADEAGGRITREADPRSLLRGIVVRLDNDRSLVVECNTYEDYRQSIYRKEILAKFGYEFVALWPANWVENPRAELDKLRKTLADWRRRNKALPVKPEMPLQLEPQAASCTVLPADGAGEAAREVMEVDPSEDGTGGGELQQEGEEDAAAAAAVTQEDDRDKRRRNAEMLGKPFLVRYGGRRKLIVFRPERAVRGDPDMLAGHLGGKIIKVAVARLSPVNEAAAARLLDRPDEFLDEVEHAAFSHFVAAAAAAPAVLDTVSASRAKSAKRAKGAAKGDARGKTAAEARVEDNEDGPRVAQPARRAAKAARGKASARDSASSSGDEEEDAWSSPGEIVSDSDGSVVAPRSKRAKRTP